MNGAAINSDEDRVRVPWQSRRFTVPLERIKRCEQLGFDAVFTAEGAGSDALTPLAYIAAHTSKIALGTHIATLTARPATVLAQGLTTIDAMAGGGRVIAGVGSGLPSIAEGWHGRKWGNPVRRMRDYVGVLRQAFASQGASDTDGNPIESTELYWEHSRARLIDPVRCQSSETSIPHTGVGALGVKPWSMSVESGFEPEIHLAAVGPQIVELTAEIADGWFPAGFAPGMMPAFQPQLDTGFARLTDGKKREDFDIWAIVDLVVTDDVAIGASALPWRSSRPARGSPVAAAVSSCAIQHSKRRPAHASQADNLSTRAVGEPAGKGHECCSWTSTGRPAWCHSGFGEIWGGST